ncbi:serine kinase [bacterium]|nr:serine kinase [candidate division CSSED10-310 bacterium]
MLLSELVQKLNLEIINEGIHMDDPVEGGYCGDLLSDVIAAGRRRDVWVTIQVHENIIAVATLKDFTAIILAKNSKPLPETLENASSENVTLLRSPLTTYQLVAELTHLGISGER